MNLISGYGLHRRNKAIKKNAFGGCTKLAAKKVGDKVFTGTAPETVVTVPKKLRKGTE